MYIKTVEEFARREVTNLWLETIFKTLFLSLWGNESQTSKTSKSKASLKLAKRWTITGFADNQILCWLIPYAQRCPSGDKVLKKANTRERELIKPVHF